MNHDFLLRVSELRKKQKFQEAMKLLCQAEESLWSAKEFLIESARLYSAMEKSQDALNFYNKAIALDPNDAELYSEFGNFLASWGEVGRAQWCHEQAVELDPENALLHQARGILLWTMRKPEESLICLLRALELSPQDAELHRNLAILYYEMQDYEQSFQHAKKCEELGISLEEEFKEGLESHYAEPAE